MKPHLQLRLPFALFMWALLTTAVFVFPAALGYDGHYDTTAYDSGEAATAYDVVPTLAASDEKAEVPGDHALFAKFARFLPGKTAPRVVNAQTIQAALDEETLDPYGVYSTEGDLYQPILLEDHP